MRKMSAAAVSGSMTLALLLLATNVSAKETITYWNPWTFGGYIKIQEDLVKAFNKTHPDIEVKISNSQGYSKLVSAVAAGAAPDVVIFFSPPDRVALPDLFVPIDNLMQRDGYTPADFIPTSVELSSWQGQVYALPFLGSSRALYRNTSLLQAAGFDPSKPPMTWDDMEQVQKKLTKTTSSGTLTQIGTALWTPTGFLRMGWFWSNDGVLYDRQTNRVSVDSQKNQETLDWLVSWAKRYDGLLQGFSPSFLDGNIALTGLGSWSLYEIKQSAPDLQFALSPMLKSPTGSYFNPGGGEINAIFIPRGSKHVEAAWTFEKWMLEEGSVLWSNIAEEMPGLKRAGEKVKWWNIDPNFRIAMNYTVYEKALLSPANQFFYQQFDNYTNKALNGELAPKAALSELQSVVAAHMKMVLAKSGM